MLDNQLTGLEMLLDLLNAATQPIQLIEPTNMMSTTREFDTTDSATIDTSNEQCHVPRMMSTSQKQRLVPQMVVDGLGHDIREKKKKKKREREREERK
jgi:hypothetical protein